MTLITEWLNTDRLIYASRTFGGLKRTLLLLIVAFFVSCGGADKVSRIHTSHLPVAYSKTYTQQHVDLVYYDPGGDELHVLLKKPLSRGDHKARITLSYEDGPTTEIEWTADEVTKICKLDRNNIPTQIRIEGLVGEGELKLWERFEMNERQAQKRIIIGEKAGLSFENYWPVQQNFFIEENGLRVSEIEVSYLGNEFSLPPAPSKVRRRAANRKVINKETQAAPFAMAEPGVYQIYTGTSTFDLLIVDEDYPKLTKANELARALRFITKNEEYQKMVSAEFPKTEIDKFWLDMAGSEERARVIIREFYGRVQRSNAFFSEGKPGWMTDRGLIYTIYGQPDAVKLDVGKERWRYRESSSNREALTFNFILDEGKYSLERHTYYEASWNAAIYNWRNGIIGKVSR